MDTGTIARNLQLKGSPVRVCENRVAPAGSGGDDGGPADSFCRSVEENSKEKLAALFPRDRSADVKAIPPGIALYWCYRAYGPGIYIHETAHGLGDALMNDGYKGHMQADALDNLHNFIENPTLDNFKKYVTEYDSLNDHCKGFHSTDAVGKPSEIGEHFTENGRAAFAYAAGSIAATIPSFVSFGLGMELRKKYPLLGYTLMTFGAANHFQNSLYPISAVIPQMNVLGGHDWTNFARLTGIHPAITASLFCMSLPMFALGLYALDKRREGRDRDRIALGNLISAGQISLTEVNSAYGSYKDKARMKNVEDRVARILNSGTGSNRELKKALGNLQKEYDRFSDYLAGLHKKEVETERKNIDRQIPAMTISRSLKNAKAEIARSWKESRIGTILLAGTLASSGAVTVAAAVDTTIKISCIARGITPTNVPPEISGLISSVSANLGRVFSAALPMAVLFGAGSALYEGSKALREPDAGLLEKGAAVSRMVFSIIGAAGLAVPGYALPLVLVGMGGQAGTWAIKKMCEKSGD